MCDDKILDFVPQGEEDIEENDGSTLTLVDEEGNEVEMAVLDVIEHKDAQYVVLLPVENMASGNMEVAILKIEFDEESGEYSYVSGNEPEFDEVFDIFQEQLQQEIAGMDDLEIVDDFGFDLEN
ncbi:MAG: DUF1292 domain-containing protein [Clostridia bacterium]|nr:DUF1292 domain-containing protein [Clostridia bacterium]